jgi:acetyl esterase
VSLHPFIATLIEKQKAAGWPGFAGGSPETARALIAAGRPAIGAGPDMDVREIEIPSRAGRIPARQYVPAGDAQAIMIYCHGGGWVVGSLDDFDTLARTLAVRSNSIVILPDYRLAPEFPFPAGLHDVEDVLVWVAAGDVVPGRSLPLIVGGDSAGANLVTVAARKLVGRVSPALQILVYPVTDCDMNNASYRLHGEGLPLTTQDMAWFFGHYAQGEALTNPDISPLRSVSFADLSPAFILVAEYDVLRDEGIAYAEKLKTAGVPVRLRRYEGATHGFLRLHNLFETANEAVNDIAAAIHAALITHDTGTGNSP